MTEITDEMVEAVARRMCEAMGIDPDEEVFSAGPFRQWKYHNSTCDVANNGQRWQHFSKDAEIAIAAHIAITDLLDIGGKG